MSIEPVFSVSLISPWYPPQTKRFSVYQTAVKAMEDMHNEFVTMHDGKVDDIKFEDDRVTIQFKDETIIRLTILYYKMLNPKVKLVRDPRSNSQYPVLFVSQE